MQSSFPSRLACMCNLLPVSRSISHSRVTFRCITREIPLWLFQSHGILSRHNLRLRAAEKIIINAFRLSFIIFYSDKVLQVIPGTKEALKYLNNLFDKNDFEVRYNLFV